MVNNKSFIYTATNVIGTLFFLTILLGLTNLPLAFTLFFVEKSISTIYIMIFLFIFSAPGITSSFSSLYILIRSQQPFSLSKFFHDYRKNFKYSMVIGVCQGVINLLLVNNIIHMLVNGFSRAFFFPSVILLFLFQFIFLTAYMLLFRFQQVSIKLLLVNALFFLFKFPIISLRGSVILSGSILFLIYLPYRFSLLIGIPFIFYLFLLNDFSALLQTENEQS